jgi:hypothetical protein
MDAKRTKSHPAVGWRGDDGQIAELVYDPIKRETAFAHWDGRSWSLERALALPERDRLVPYSPQNNLIKNEVVALPSEPSDYGSERELASEVADFIHRYVDLSPVFERIAAYYVLLTWVYDAFKEVPYLRCQGDYGSGKTRALLTIGSLCYKAFFASGASTVSPIFHILDAFRGTLILDEADFRFSDEKAEIVKILNNGTVDGLPVLRTLQDRQKEFNPRAFRVFGPKIIAMRGSYDDRALESRFLTERMGARPLRDDIPLNTPERQKDEARVLRNKLLLFRFRNRAKARLNPSLVNPLLEPRLNQILVPLLSVVDDAGIRADIASLASDSQNSLVAERGLSVEGQVLEILARRFSKKGVSAVPIQEIATTLQEKHGSEYDRPLSSRYLGSVLRKRLQLSPYKRHGVYAVSAAEIPKIAHLCRRYGFEFPSDIHTPDVAPRDISGDMGSTGTSQRMPPT